MGEVWAGDRDGRQGHTEARLVGNDELMNLKPIVTVMRVMAPRALCWAR